MNIKIRSYIGPGGWIKWLINRRSSPAWHTEWQFSKRYFNISFSSPMQGEQKGCRFKMIDYSHPKRWITHIIPLTAEQEDKAWEKAHQLKGRKYDLIGLVSFSTPWKIVVPRREREWCTEADSRLLNASDILHPLFLVPDTLHPQGLVDLLDDLGYERE